MNPTQQIPLVDLGLQHSEVEAEIREGFDRVLAAGSFILGPEVERFEQEFAAYCGVDHVVGVGNGTDALELALRAAGVGRDDRVVMPANTFVATAEAVARIGSPITFVDCDDDFLLDTAALADLDLEQVGAVIGVHLYGQTAPIEKIREIVGPDVLVMEDAAQSQGARRNGVRAGGLGDVAGTSFYPGKNLGAYGDAGAVITSSAQIADQVRKLRSHGGIRRYEHLEVGVNSRLDGLQGVVLSAKLARLDGWNDQRRAAAAYYEEQLSELDEVVTPRTAAGNEHVFHLYVVRVPDRDRIAAELNEAGVGAAIHYPTPVHLLPAFASLGVAPGSFQRAEQFATEILSLPIYPGITRAQQDRVVSALKVTLSR